MINVSDKVDGKYRVTRVLGEGGMGTVVQAYRDTLDMHVAIKFMRSEMVRAPGATERFLREAKALAKLKSQHAVKVLDLGVHGRHPYIVMEHLEGMDLQTMLDQQGPLNASDAARYVRQACEAIAEAHALGICHRDLKPANLFLARGPSGRSVVKVLDFGIAKVLQPEDTKASLQNSLTGMNMLVGTLPYMSPEQLVAPRSVDGRADIWSLGVVLYQLITGELPFQSRDPYEVQQAIRFGPCTLHGISWSMEAVLRRCLEKDRANRYATATELAIALRSIATESLSPYGANSVRGDSRPRQQVVIRSATASPLPIPGARQQPALEQAEGLLPALACAATEPAGVQNPAPPLIINAIPDDIPDSTRTVPWRVAASNRNQATVVMPPPVAAVAPRREALAVHTLTSAKQDARPDVPRVDAQVQVPGHRNVLVVHQPIRLSRRSRLGSRRSRCVWGALATSVLLFGINAYRDKQDEVVQTAAAPDIAKRPIAKSFLHTRP